MTELFGADPLLTRLNGDALRSPKLSIVNEDAFGWLERHDDAIFDLIVIDFPDPSTHAIGKLYSTTFYALVDRHLAASGYAVVQATSPLVARKSFWTVAATLEAVGFDTMPYHAHVPSFGEWGFVIASRRPLDVTARRRRLADRLALPDAAGPAGAVRLSARHGAGAAEPNRLSNQGLVHTFEAEWGQVRD